VARKHSFFRLIELKSYFAAMFQRLVVTALILFPFISFAQYETVQEGEFGISVGAAHYFGDLNTRAKVNRPKMAAGIFFRKNFGNYIAARLSANYARVGYSDIYNTNNEYMHRRNLSFNSNIWELTLQGDFNFFKFMPGEPGYNFTPYVTFGAGVFNYDPFAYLGGKKYNLRSLNTEGQGNALYPDRKPYSPMAFCIPFGVGFKYSINRKTNIGFEVVHRFTTTDYLDDVSKTYIGIDKFSSPGTPPIAAILQDRSFETGTPIGDEGRQRGFSKQKDQYAIAEIGISFNIMSYRCPSTR